jgi:glycerol-3-phosphate dehydrogenase
VATRSAIAADVVVVGAGVIGCAIAARLSSTRASVCMIERRHDVADETSKSNTGVTDCGWECEPESLESRLVRASSKRWEEICDRLDVPFRRCGALSLARSDEDLARLDGIADRAARNGVNVRRLGADDVRRVAPYVTPDARAAIEVPEEGVIDSIRLTIAYAELAAANGAAFRFSDPLIGAERDPDAVLAVTTPTASIRTRFVVNAAGLCADDVSRLLGAEEFAIWPRRGEYLLLDREASGIIDHVITQIPTEHTRGVMVVPSTHGSVLLGPTAEDDEDKGDRSTHGGVLDRVFAECEGLVPGIDRRQVIKSFAGLRPAAERTYRVERSGEVRNLIQACAIRSTGVSASWGVGEYVAELLAEAGLDMKPRPDAIARLPRRPRLRDLEDAGELAMDPLARTVICACEKVTAREIHDALTAPVPARSIAGIAKRTRATWGRCQGAACLSGVSFVASMHLDGEAWELPWAEPGATLGVGATHG